MHTYAHIYRLTWHDICILDIYDDEGTGPKWTKDGAPVPPDAIIGANHSLTIPSVQPEHEGTYNCTGQNGASRSIMLEVTKRGEYFNQSSTSHLHALIATSL